MPHKKKQDALQLFWQEHPLYRHHNGEELFTIDTPPPTYSGKLHIGHIFSYTHTDFIARYQRMQKKQVWYPFGFDDNGLPTERYIEKKEGVSAAQLGRGAFIALCREEVKKGHAIFRVLWQKMGISADWEYTYSTISREVQALSQKSFITLYNKGYIYRKNDPVPYCTAFRTSVTQAELESIDTTGVFITIPFATSSTTSPLSIATTRPELLASCQAVMVHPDDQRYQSLISQKVQVPFYGYFVPVIADKKVIPSKGTGAVMCCTFGDSLDVVWYQEHNFSYKQSIDNQGKMTAITGPLEGMTVAEARKKMIMLLKEQGLLLKEEAITHSVAVYERSKREIEYLVLPQWYVSVLALKETFIALGKKISWHPTTMFSRYLDWVNNLQWDWCISRQRAYGIPFPVWFTDNDEVVLANESSLPVDPLTEQPKNGGAPLRGDTDVMDTWNTSSLTPYIVQALYEQKTQKPCPSFFPMSIRPQAHDIIRTWAFDTIVKSWMHTGDIPWKHIIISGHVLAQDHKKISKSLGNTVMEPEVLLEKYPVDAIRYWAASAKLGTDVSFSETQFLIGSKLIIKLRNAGVFVKTQGVAEDTPQAHSINQSNHSVVNQWIVNQWIVNQWIMEKIREAQEQYEIAFAHYEYAHALALVEKVFRNDFCDNYIEIVKGVLFSPEDFPASVVQEIKETLHDAFFLLLQLFAPFLVYTTEEVYQEIYRTAAMPLSIHMTLFRKDMPKYRVDDFDIIITIIEKIRCYKTEQKLSFKAPIQRMTLRGAAAFGTLVTPLLPLLQKMFSIVAAHYEEGESIEVLFE